VCLFRKEANPQERYVFRYYVCDAQTHKLLDPEQLEVQTEIEHHYGALIRNALLHDDVKNTLFIFDPKIQNYKDVCETEELKVYEKFNDIILGPIRHFETLEQQDYNVLECVDMSLRAYLVSLYLKNEFTKIYLSIKSV
jgi:hypothetical protein